MKYNLSELVTIDYETYFDAKYSLRAKAYNLSAYIRDPQFLIHCCAIKIGKKPSKCYPRDKAIAILQGIDWTRHDLLAHNNFFDGGISQWHLGITPRRYFCTLQMTRALHSEHSKAALNEIATFYGIGAKTEGLNASKGKRELDKTALNELMAYCNNDNELCYQIFTKQIEYLPTDEAALIDMTLRMFIEPVFQLNEPRCEIALAQEIKERLMFIAVSGHDEKTLTSNNKFVAALEALGVDAPKKISKYNGEVTYALSEGDQEFLDLQRHEDRRVVRLVNGRLAAKSTISETRAARLLQAGANGQRIPVLLNYYGAKTGRWSGGNKLNFQNFPRGSELRKSIIAPAGHVIAPVDSAQIEARVVAWLADQQDVLDIFASGGDIYSHQATGIYGRPINKKDDPDERFVGKVATLGLGYGMGPAKFQTTLALGILGPPVDIPLAKCKNIVAAYRKSNNMIAQLWTHASTMLKRMTLGEGGIFMGFLEYDHDAIWLPNGMCLSYPALEVKTKDGKATSDKNDFNNEYSYLSRNGRVKTYGALMVENIVQALSRVIISEQMLKTENYLKALKLKKDEVARIATMTHDESVCVVPERYGAKTVKDVVKIMATSPTWAVNLPLNAEGAFAREYSK